MINRLSHSRLGNIRLIALATISYFAPRSLRSLVTKYDIVSRAIELISPRPPCDSLYIYMEFFMLGIAVEHILLKYAILARGRIKSTGIRFENSVQ